MPIKTSGLYSPLWKSCDKLRGAMHASRYKDYLLVLLLLKLFSDRYAGLKDTLIEVRKGDSFADATRFVSAKAALLILAIETHCLWKVGR